MLEEEGRNNLAGRKQEKTEKKKEGNVRMTTRKGATREKGYFFVDGKVRQLELKNCCSPSKKLNVAENKARILFGASMSTHRRIRPSKQSGRRKAPKKKRTERVRLHTEAIHHVT